MHFEGKDGNPIPQTISDGTGESTLKFILGSLMLAD